MSLQNSGVGKSTNIISGWSWNKNSINRSDRVALEEDHLVCVSPFLIRMVANMHRVENVHEGVRS
jgi:hypothetical protein